MTGADAETAGAVGKHGTEEFRRIAEDGLIYRCHVGSGAFGLSIGGLGDRDEMGVCIEPPSWVIGVRSFDPHTRANPGERFHQYEDKTAWRRPGGLANRSGPGDLDVVVYSLRKFARLALEGNPSVLTLLFIPEDEIVAITPLGRELRRLAPAFVSRRAAEPFAGYLEQQRENMLSHGGKGRDVTRPELIEQYGFDCKYAAHMVRLGVQGTELLETGQITLPVPEPWRTWIRDLRAGKHTMAEALETAAALEKRIRELGGTEDTPGTSPLPDHPDRDAVDQWLVSAYQRAWAGEA